MRESIDSDITDVKEVMVGPKIVQIPTSWSVEKIGSSKVSKKIKAGGTPRTTNDEYYGGNIKYVKIEDMSAAGKYIETTKHHLTREGLDSASTWLVPEGSLLLSMYASYGKAAITRKTMATNQAILGIIPSDSVNLDYLFYASSRLRPYFESVVLETTQANLNKSIVENTPILVPPLTEQRRIAEILSTVDTHLRQSKDIVNCIKRLRAGTFQDLLLGGVGGEETCYTKVPMIPKKWELPTQWNLEFLEDVTELITDGTHQTPNYTDSGVAFLRAENIKNNQIDWDKVNSVSQSEYEKIVSGKVPNQGDVLLSKNGTIGRTRVVDWDQQFAYYVSLCLIRPRPALINSRYLAEVLSSEICLQQAKIRSKKATVSNLHLEEIRKLSIPIPPLETQERIVHIIKIIDELLSFETEYLETVEELKCGLMQDLLTGKVRVPVEA